MTQTYGPPAGPTTRTARFLTTAWAGLTLLALAFLLLYGHNAPWADEWEFVPALVGDEPILPWLWKQHNEHRLPLPRLVYRVLFVATHDFRSGMLLEWGVMAGAAFGLMRLAASVRGAPHWADAFFPLTLLHPGHAENWLMGYQICFAFLSLFALGLIATAVRSTHDNSGRTGWKVAVSLFALLACGASGFPFLIPLGAWLVYLAIRCRSRVLRVGLFIVPLLGIAYCAAYFNGYERPTGHPEPNLDHPGRAVLVALQFLSTGWGFGLSGFWNLPAAAALTMWALLVLQLRKKWREPTHLGLIAVSLGTLGLATVIGLGRAGFDHEGMGLAARYSWLAVPVLACGYYSSLTTTTRYTRFLPAALCLAALLAFPFNLAVGWSRGIGHDQWLEAIATDARAGIPSDEIVRRHLTGSGQEERAIRGIPLLKQASISEFAVGPMGTYGSLGIALGLAVLAGWGAFLLTKPGRESKHDPQRASALFRQSLGRRLAEYPAHVARFERSNALTWTRCESQGPPLLLRDTQTGEWTILQLLVADVEPADGSGLEDVAAARMSRPVTARFVFRDGDWHPSDRPIFNLSPAEVLARSSGRFVPLEPPQIPGT